METVIISYEADNKAVRQVLSGLAKLGAITVKKSPYSEEFVQKVQQGDKALRQGKGTAMDINAIFA
jgi:hypothetical protein